MTQTGIPTITNDVPDVPKRLTFEEYRFYQDHRISNMNYIGED